MQNLIILKHSLWYYIHLHDHSVPCSLRNFHHLKLWTVPLFQSPHCFRTQWLWIYILQIILTFAIHFLKLTNTAPEEMEAIPKGNESSEPTIQARKGNPNITPKFNIAPEIWWLEDCFRFDMAYFQGRTVKLPGSNHLFNRYKIFKWKNIFKWLDFPLSC